MSHLPSSGRAAGAQPVPAGAGIGLRAPHYRALIEQRPDVSFIEVHSENYFGAGGPPLHHLALARQHYPLSLHGVGMSLGSVDPLDLRHLAALAALVQRFEPVLVSEHLCWSSVDGIHFNDLLPLPYTEEALAHVCTRIEQVQQHLRRRILVENVSSYLRYEHSTIPEPEFLAAVAERSDCLLLVDVNNVHVSACNHGFDARAWLAAIPPARVAEIHLAGHSVKRLPEGDILIDTHDTHVAPPVWALHALAIECFGQLPTLIEWDTDLPELEVLVGEARRAEHIAAGDHACVA